MPMKIPCRTLIKAVIKMEKVQVAVACKGLHPNLRYIGTRNKPPPKPKPLKIPAMMLFFIIISLLVSTIF
jgi:hypothetical protein